MRPLGDLLAVRAAQLAQQPPAAVGKVAEVLHVEALGAHVAHQPLVDALQRDGPVLEHRRQVVGGLVDVRVAEHHQGAGGRAGDQVHRGLEHGDERALAADQGAGDVPAVLGQQLLQAVAGHAAGDPREAGADLASVALAQLPQPPVDLADPARPAGEAVPLLRRGWPDPQAGPVVGEDLQLGDVVGGPARHLRVHPAGVVPDHPAEGAVVVRGRVRAEGEAVPLGRGAQHVEDHARLDPGEPALRVHCQHPVEVLREVDHDGDVAALPGQAGAAAAGQHRHPGLAAARHRGDHVLGAPGNDHADRHLPVVGGVGGVRAAAAGVEADLAPHHLPQRGGEALGAGGAAARAGRGHWELAGHLSPPRGLPPCLPGRGCRPRARGNGGVPR